MKITRRSAQQPTSSAQIVASIDDLLLLILLALPIRSLIRFKSVSKHWLSLISNPQFAILHNRDPKPALGLFLRDTRSGVDLKFDYVNFDVRNPITSPFSVLKFRKDPSAGVINIVQSCNGLLLCSSFGAQRPRQNFHVFNPTTKQLTTLPKLSRKATRGVGLAFDPAKSPAYKVVRVRDSELVSGSYQIEIYSSENGPWRVSGEPFTANHDFKNGVYWNGAIHWLCNLGYDNSLYFNVDEERLGEMPPIPYCSEPNRGVVTYFGESCGHLHLIDIYGRPEIEFSVYEMKSDYSGWFVKYEVDLSSLTSAFPGMIRIEVDPWEFGHYVLSVLTVIRGESEEDAFLVLQIPGQAIRYNLASKTFQKLCDFEGADEDESWLRFNDFCAHQYIESLLCV